MSARRRENHGVVALQMIRQVIDKKIDCDENIFGSTYVSISLLFFGLSGAY